jgi:hypothetical protein
VANIGPELYAFSRFPGRRYTSNVVESINSYYGAERELPVLEMLDEVWHEEMDKAVGARNEDSEIPATFTLRASFD